MTKALNAIGLVKDVARQMRTRTTSAGRTPADQACAPPSSSASGLPTTRALYPLSSVSVPTFAASKAARISARPRIGV